MSIRIYALAKQLKIENKKLVDICNEIGITGKGSALASLTEEEVATIKAHLDRSRGGRSAGTTAPAGAGPVADRQSGAVRREDYIAPSGAGVRKVPVLERRPDRMVPKRPGPETPAETAVPATPAPVETPVAAPEIEVAASVPKEAAPAVVTETVPVALRQPPVEAAPPAEPEIVAAPVQEAEPPVSVQPAQTPGIEAPVSPAPAVHGPVVEETPVEPSVVEAPPVEIPQLRPAPPSEPAAEPPAIAAKVAEPATPPSEPPAAPPGEAPAVTAPVRPAAAIPTRPPVLPPLGSRVPPIRRQPPKGGPGGPKAPPPKAGPAIKLAPIPAAAAPKAPKRNEPAPQKPDIKLAPDAIRASKMGAKPLSEHLKKQEQKRKASSGPKKPGGKERAGEGLPPEAVVPAKDKDKDKDKDKRRGRTGTGEGEDELGLALGGREQRQLKRKRTTPVRGPGGGPEEEESRPASRAPRRLRRTGACTAAPRKSHVIIQLPCTVRSFSEAVGVPVDQLLRKLMELGSPMTITATLDQETAELLAVGMGVEVDFRQPISLEEKLLARFNQDREDAELEPRAPVVTFLGHVDHGKTSLLDRIIGLDVAAHEKGGITQHIRAYRLEKDGRPITFVDTPGHEAFTAMRARGAMVTDIAVLVVAADDGVMPQTEEAISHLRAAGVPIVVAMNKIDLPGVNPDRVLQELATHGLLASQWGGDTELVRTSAITGEGMDELLETLLTVAELHEYQADADRPATGVCLEAEVQTGRGVMAKVLVQKGTLRVGDVVVCGAAHGRVKAMYDTLNPYKKYKEGGPTTPVNLAGLDVAPGAGDRFYVLEDISEARQIAQERAAANRLKEQAGAPKHITLEDLYQRISVKEEVQNLNIILRADVRGSIEAILKELGKLQHPEVQIRVLQAMVGGITEADVHLADASDAVVIGFNVAPDEKARVLADQRGVQIRRYDIIYQVSQDLKAALEGMLKPEQREVELGRALVKRSFHISRVGTVAGCQVLAGTIQRDGRARILRDSRVVGEYPIDSLKREKDDVREVRQGFECGIRLAGFDDVKEGDILEVYKIEEIRRTF